MADKIRNEADWVKFDENPDGLADIQLVETTKSNSSAVIVDPAKLLDAVENQATYPGSSIAKLPITDHKNKLSLSSKVASPLPPPVDSHLAKQASERNVFKNGKILCAVYPENTSMAWVVPARYNPYSMPKSLADDRLTLSAEDYVAAMEMITNDYRFRCFCIFYSRLLAFWILLSIIVLVLVLLSQPNAGLSVLIFTMFWVVCFFAGIFGVLIIKKQILVGLRHCVQSANKFLVGSDILAGVDDRGVLSCHKVVIIFMYLKTAECIPDIERLIMQHNPTAHPSLKQMRRKELEEFAELLVLKYSNSFVKDTTKKKLVFPTCPLEGVSEFAPKHCSTSYCLCQYIEKVSAEKL